MRISLYFYGSMVYICTFTFDRVKKVDCGKLIDMADWWDRIGGLESFFTLAFYADPWDFLLALLANDQNIFASIHRAFSDNSRIGF